MNAIGNPFQQLVERKLWPVALLLVAALVAVPFVLKADKDSGHPLPPTAAVAAGQAANDPIVTTDDAGRRDQVRAVLGDRKDPFRPARLQRVKPPEDPSAPGGGVGQTASASTGATGSTDAGGGSSGGGSSGGGSSGGGAPAPGGDAPSGGTTPPSSGASPDPAPATPKPPEQSFEVNSLEVRFGSTDGQLSTRNVKRLTGLPGGARPAILYLGLTGDRKGAVFIVAATVETIGDGTCAPTPRNCETITLKPGETEFFTRGKQQWELDLVKIHKDRTTDARRAAKARSATAAGGRERLRAMRDRAGRYRYDQSSGTLEQAPRSKRAAAVTSQFTAG